MKDFNCLTRVDISNFPRSKTIIQGNQMKEAIACWCVVILAVFCLAQGVQADELSRLKEQIKEMETRHQEEMKELRARIKSLEAKQKSGYASGLYDVPEDVNEKVAALEEEIAYIQEQHEGFATKIDEMTNINLYATLRFENLQNTDSVLDGQDVELLASTQLTDRLKAFTEIEFERTATTKAGDRQGEIEVEQGWLEYTINEYIKPRFGIIPVPFGRFSLEHFDPARDLTTYPIAMGSVVPVTWSEAGVGFTGNAFLGNKLGSNWFTNLTLDYQLFAVNGLTNSLTDTKIKDSRGAFGIDNNNNKALVGRLGISPFLGQEIGLSSYFGDYDDDNHKVHGFDVDWKLTKGPFELIGEYAFFNLEEGFQKDSPTLKVPETLRGGYIQANYHFWFDFLNNTFLGKRFEEAVFTAILRYDQARIDDDNDEGTGANKEKSWTIGFNYRPVETWAFKLEYQFNRSKNEALRHGDNDGFIGSVTAAF
jgi:hypothetical protein